MPLNPAIRIEQIHPDTIDFRSRILSNGGTISDADLTAVDVFVKEIYGNNLRSLLLDVSPLAGNNLAAALTKLWYPSGVLSSLSNVGGFVDADYSRTTGLKGNGTSYLNTGFIPSSFFAQSVSAGVYNRSNTNMQDCDICSSTGNGIDFFLLIARWDDGSTYFDSYYGADNKGRLVTSTADSRGLVIGSRVSSNNSAIYLNGNEIASNNTFSGSAPIYPIWYFAFNNGNVPAAFSSKYSGFFFIGYGLNSSQVSNLYKIVQNLMTAFGRQ